MTRHKCLAALIAVVSLTAALPARAQLSGDQVPRQRTIPIRESVKKQIEDNRFHLGPIRVTPFLDLRNTGYNNNLFGTQENRKSDFTATVAAGVHTITPFGAKTFLLVDLVPEYTVYAKYSELNQGGHKVKGSLLGLFNRVSTELTGLDSSGVRQINSESERAATEDRKGGIAGLEVDILQRLSVFGNGETEKLRFSGQELADVPDSNVRRLDRDETAIRTGVRYRFSPSFDVSGQVEKTKSEFSIAPAARDLQTTAYLLGVRVDRPRIFVNLSGGTRKREALNGSSVPENSGGSGSYFVSYALSRSSFDVFGARQTVFSIDSPYFIETRNGIGANLQTGYRYLWRAFGQVGNNSYPASVLASGGTQIKRSDDVREYGLTLGIRLFRKAALTVRVSKSVYRSDVSSLDRDIFRTGIGITYSGDFAHLSGDFTQ